ncbi:hypothetical protein E2C01_031310 [Portunus trituberculatus]|uniref:Uncharacterized protein n=1 Tax=Portunus trituberculatus TaxID=210409 RepID=A0A5B7EXB8_PORTR|nr:hypothetical protein [Portunus trituberculatus]
MVVGIRGTGTRKEGWNSGDCGDPQPTVPREEPRVKLQSEVAVLITFVACLLTSGTGDLTVDSQFATHSSTHNLTRRSSALLTSSTQFSSRVLSPSHKNHPVSTSFSV